MRATIITAWDKTYAPLAEIALPLMKAYCTRHGYGLHVAEYHTDPARLRTYGDRLKLDLFQKYYDGHDIICWLDIDVIVMNGTVKLEDVLGERPFIWTYDVNGPLSGFWIAACRPEVWTTLNAVKERALTMGGLIARESEGQPHTVTLQMEPRGTSDQTTMRALMNLPPYSAVLGGYNCVPGKWAGHCYPRDVMDWPEQFPNYNDYEPGDWLVTFPAVPLDRRIELMSAYAEKAVV